MGLNRMMMKNGEVKGVDGYKFWTDEETHNKTISFTVPPGVKRIKVFVKVVRAEGEPLDYNYASISNTMTNKRWGLGGSETDDIGQNLYHVDVESIVGVTPNKTYTLYFECWDTYGVTFSWGQAINDMTPTVEDY